MHNIKNHGFTLLELTISLSVLIILTHYAIPSAIQLGSSVRLGTAAHQFLRSYSLGRATALQRGFNIHLCARDGIKCSQHNQWEQGWIVFIDNNDNQKVEPEEILNLSEALPSGYRFSSNTNSTHLIFLPEGRVIKLNGSLPLMTLRMCNPRATSENMQFDAREMVINASGRIRLQRGRNGVTQCS